MQAKLDEIVEESRRHRVRKQKNILLPSGGPVSGSTATNRTATVKRGRHQRNNSTSRRRGGPRKKTSSIVPPPFWGLGGGDGEGEGELRELRDKVEPAIVVDDNDDDGINKCG